MTTNRVEFELCVAAGHASLPGHFPGHPVVPGVLLLDQMLAAIERATSTRATHLRQVKFSAPLQPDEVAQAWFEVRGAQVSFGVTTQRAGAQLTLASGRLLLCEPPLTQGSM